MRTTGAFVVVRVLVACETSGVMRRAFAALGHDAWSCDLLPAEDGSNHHIRGDVRDHLADGWDLLIVAHPPCTRLCNSGVRWLHTPPPGRTLADMWRELEDGVELFTACWRAPVDRVAVENPIMHRRARERHAEDWRLYQLGGEIFHTSRDPQTDEERRADTATGPVTA